MGSDLPFYYWPSRSCGTPRLLQMPRAYGNLTWFGESQTFSAPLMSVALVVASVRH